jgi:muramidase (phage lysozyme)
MSKLTKYEKGLLDLIAWAEGTLGVSQNGYDVTFNFYKIIGWTPNTDIVHGNWKLPFKGKTSNAAGRYQFLYNTWVEINNNVNVPMTKDNQDKAALKLVNRRFKEKFIDNRTVTISELTNRDKFDIMMNKLAPEWAAFIVTKDVIFQGKTIRKGQGLYSGQGSKFTVDDFYNVYKKALAKY